MTSFPLLQRLAYTATDTLELLYFPVLPGSSFPPTGFLRHILVPIDNRYEDRNKVGKFRGDIGAI
jgi:hypothetical protein